ncbi:hypothetical protein VTL71DRAFT_11044 [Oculimacula yallundae]|uniref:CCZ1/INTU/HSP4 first Longin domain-containing protein n=1 Tax=Oculimacula yallundae TaxID=86028 RepID=A0ABR4CWJ7_9HELO
MTAPTRATPAQLGFLAIYNPSLGTTDETIEDQIVYYSTPGLQERRSRDPKAKKGVLNDAEREENNEQLRQIGLAQGMVEFGRSFSDGKAVDTVETEKSRIILHELESGWWILASINLTVLPIAANTDTAGKGKGTEQQQTTEYSSREVKPAILILGDLLRAHSTFLLHHAASLSALFVRTKRSKFMGILGRYWDTFLTTWNVLMHGNPANNLYSGIKIAACGELGMGVGEEERGSGEREVLEGLVGRIDGLVDVIVSKFGDKDPPAPEDTGRWKFPEKQVPMEPWLGSGNEPSSDDGAIFLGTGALSRKSLRDVSHWMEDLYRWGPYTYGVIDNPSSNRRAKKFRRKPPPKNERSPSLDVKKSRQVYGLSLRDKVPRETRSRQGSLTSVPPMPVNEARQTSNSPDASKRRPTLQRNRSSITGSESDSAKGNKFVQYLKLGYGTHWSLGSMPPTEEHSIPESAGLDVNNPSKLTPGTSNSSKTDGTIESSPYATKKESAGHYLIGLLGDIENDDDEPSEAGSLEEGQDHSNEDSNSRLLLRTITVELEREEDARKEADISIDLGGSSKGSSTKVGTSERSGASLASYESQDRNKTKKLRTVVYVNKPFIFVFLFELRTDALAMSGLYRSLHYQISPLLKPLLASTAYRASRPELNTSDESATPIYDLVWDPKLLVTNSTIPNIPDPLQVTQPGAPATWSRIEALNTHMQIINTYIASSADNAALERTCKTSRGWWVVWTRIPDPEPPGTPKSDKNPTPIPEESTESLAPPLQPQGASLRTSTFKSSMKSGPAHPFLETTKVNTFPKDKEIFLIRRASDHVGARTTSRFASGSSVVASESSWTSGPGKLAQGIGVDTKRYIEGLLNMNR